MKCQTGVTFPVRESMARLGGTGLVLGHSEDVAVRILESCDLARGTLPDAERVLIHVRVFLEDDAAIAQKGHDLLDVLHFPSENRGRNRRDFLHPLRNDRGVPAAEDTDVGIFVLEGEAQDLFVEMPCSLRVRGSEESVQREGGACSIEPPRS
jgi:hypothetical protein